MKPSKSINIDRIVSVTVNRGREKEDMIWCTCALCAFWWADIIDTPCCDCGYYRNFKPRVEDNSGIPFLKNMWRDLAGEKEIDTTYNPNYSNVEKDRKTEWSDEFEYYMRNRLIMGKFRYGELKSRSKSKYNRIDSIFKRTKLFLLTGNDEYLVDIANMCMLEFVEGEHPLKHFKMIDDGEHVKEK